MNNKKDKKNKKGNSIILIISILIFVVVFVRIVVGNYQTLKHFYTFYFDNKKTISVIETSGEELDKLKFLVQTQSKEKEIKPEISFFLKNRYLFKYNDYCATQITNIERIKFNSKNYIQMELRFSVLKTGTLLGVINMFYKENFIYKIELKNKNSLMFYIDEELLENKVLNK